MGYIYPSFHFLWSSQGVVVRLSGVEVHILIFYSLLVSVILQGTIVSQKKYRAEIIGLKKLSYTFILGIFLMLNNIAFFYAFKNTTIANAVLTHYTAPIIVAFLAAAFLGERVTVRLITAIAVASAGLWILLDGFSIRPGQGMCRRDFFRSFLPIIIILQEPPDIFLLLFCLCPMH
jgi:drug/metabolite transporter (DMT)-like permease